MAVATSSLPSLITLLVLVRLYVSHCHYVFGLSVHSSSSTTPTSMAFRYNKARYIRTIYGHDAAQPLYQEILENHNPNDRTAASRIAAHPETVDRHCRVGKGGTGQQKLDLIQRLQTSNFHPDAIANLIFQSNPSQKLVAKKSSAPLYIQPLRAGQSPPPPLPTCALDVCIQLFLMAVCLPVSVCQQYLGDDITDLLEALGVAFRETVDNMEDNVDDDDNSILIVPYVHVMPMNIQNRNSDKRETVYLATDLHPNVLSTTTINKEGDGTVMYVGPDSIALVDHWITLNSPKTNDKIIDICTGSGIQAICLSTMAALEDNGNIDVTCIDINPRALQFTELNFGWNGLPTPKLVQGDITQEFGDIDGNDWKSIFGQATTIVSNPPFLPVPVLDDEISKRYGLFSSGGESGEIVLKRIVELACTSLVPPSSNKDESGILAVVSEFMNPQSNFVNRCQDWWNNATTGDAAEGILLTNEISINADTYSERRADSQEEIQRWMKHLSNEGISHVSPGLLFMKKVSSDKDDESTTVVEKKNDAVSHSGRLKLFSYLVPHSDQGSIWTPTNDLARAFTKSTLEKTNF